MPERDAARAARVRGQRGKLPATLGDAQCRRGRARRLEEQPLAVRAAMAQRAHRFGDALMRFSRREIADEADDSAHRTASMHTKDALSYSAPSVMPARSFNWRQDVHSRTRR